MNKVTNWSPYVKGEVTCYNWKLNRVQVKITDSYYINNFVDYVCTERTGLLCNLDKIVLLGNHNPIAIYPREAEDISDVSIYLESIKNTDIHTILISVVEDCDLIVDSLAIDDILLEIKSVTKMDVRYVLID